MIASGFSVTNSLEVTTEKTMMAIKASSAGGGITSSCVCHSPTPTGDKAITRWSL